jgi:hypothetical protein
MRFVVFFLLFLIPVNGYGAATQITASGGSPIPIAFSASNAQSQVRACPGNVVEVLNQTSTALAVGFGRSSSVPSSDYVFVPPGPNSGHVIRPKGGLNAADYVYIRSAVSAITSGTVQVSCYTEEQ